MKKLLILIIVLVIGGVTTTNAQSMRGFQVNIMVQTVPIYNLTIPPAADAIKARYLVADGSEVIDYKNGTQLVLKQDDTIEKYSADRNIRQVFAFSEGKTTVIQYHKEKDNTVKTIFKEDDKGNFVPERSEVL